MNRFLTSVIFSTGRHRLYSLLFGICSCMAALAAPANEGGPRSIFNSIRLGDMAALRSIRSQAEQISSRDPQGNTPLIYAAAYADARAVRVLLERGADPNATNNTGLTALMRAAGDYDKVRLLLRHGADPNKKSALGNTALMISARTYPSAKTVDALLKKGADIHATNVFGASAILTAAASGDTETVRLLLQQGANVNAVPARSSDGVIWGGGRTALGWAALLGYQDCAKLLLEKGASINCAEGFGTPLSQAVWHNEKSMAKFLLAHGADPNLRDRTADFTPLHWAASTDYAKSDIAELLLAHGAEVNVEGGGPVDALMGVPQTALLLAQKRGQTDLASALLKAGAQPAERLLDERASSAPVARVAASGGSKRIREAVQKAVPRLQETARTSAGVFVQRGQACNSCHQQYLPMMALGIVRDRGLERDEEKSRDLLATVFGRPEPGANQEPTFHPAAAPTIGYKLLGLAMERAKATEETDAIVSYLAAIQGRDGNWNNPLPRPPIQTGDISATALSVHALQTYALPCRKAEFAKRVDRARAWLWKQQPSATDEQTFQILGLAWAGEPSQKLAKLTDKLRSQQRADGGWSQLASLSSDAYATGQVLFALHAAGELPTSDAAYQRGLQFLLENQLPDGTWRVRRRAFPFQPTMSSGFAHGRDSWISAAGTSWAVAALSLALPVTNQTLSAAASTGHQLLLPIGPDRRRLSHLLAHWAGR